MAASTSDKITHVALATKTELASPGYNTGDSSINCSDLSVWPTDYAVYFGMDQVDSDGVRIEGTYTEWKGIVSGSSIGSLELIYGDDQNYPAASTTRVMLLVTAAWANALADALLSEHYSTGAHKDITADSLSVAGDTATDTFETTGDATIGGGASVAGDADIAGDLSAANAAFSGLVTGAVSTTASGSTITPAADAGNFYTVTALAAAATIAAPSGTPVDGQNLTLRIKDNGTARALSWNSIYRAVGVTLPTTTVISKLLYVSMKYNGVDSKWDVIAVGKEA